MPYMLPTLSSYTLDEMLAARTPDQVVFSQLYVNPERSRSEEYVAKLEAAGVQALFVTVDAPQLGRREKDMRNKFTQQGSDVQGDDEDEGAVDRSQGATRAISSYIDPGLNWEDVPWLKSITKMKVLLKGVQCAEDAVMAFKSGLAGCVLSNHGGRQLDTCRPGIEVLPEVMEAVKAEGATKENFAVFIDGGVRRGGDVFKAVALGAQAVGVGRPVLYSLASYGQNGIVRMVHMLQDELQMVMRLAGTPNIPSITEKHVITTNLADHIVPLPLDCSQEFCNACMMLQPAKPAKPKMGGKKLHSLKITSRLSIVTQTDGVQLTQKPLQLHQLDPEPANVIPEEPRSKIAHSAKIAAPKP